MLWTIADSAGILLATLLTGVVLLLPAVALMHVLGAAGIRRQPPMAALATALVLAYAILPVLDSALAHAINLDAALVVHLALAACGVHILARWLNRGPRPRLSRPALACAGLWLAVILVTWADIDWDGRLFPSLVMIDAVKHAATVRALVETNAAPPLDPFFLRSEPAGYYYFYYLASALTLKAGAGLIDARAAVAGQIFWTGLALVVVLLALMRQAGLAARGTQRRLRTRLVLVLAAMGGLQIVPVVLIGLVTGFWLAQVNWWNTQVTSLPMSLIWVPHHVAALVASMTGLMLLARIAQRLPEGAAFARLNHMTGLVGLAALAFASAAGMSVWVASTAALATAVWLLLLLRQGRIAAALAVMLAGALSLALALPYLRELLTFRAGEGVPIAFEIRTFPFTDIALQSQIAIDVARILALPLSYFIEFGVLMIGAGLYWWRSRDDQPAAGRDMRQLLLVLAATGLAVATFLKSTIVNNDLAWRAILFTQAAAVVWSAAAIAALLDGPRVLTTATLRQLPAVLGLTAAIGLASVVYDVAGLRLFHALRLGGAADMTRQPHVDHEVRAAYTWLAFNTAGGSVVQHNPDAERAFGYGLYGTARVAVSDRHNGRLFGAPPKAVTQRVTDLRAVFAGTLSPRDARQRLAAHDVNVIVVTSADPIWADRSAWIWTADPLYASAHVRVLPVSEGRP